MDVVGHLLLGYLVGKASASRLKLKLNVPLIFVFSIIPDIDYYLQIESHRGPTHSIIVALLVFIPILIIFRRKAIPYLLALLSHTLIGDLIAGNSIQLFWPITTTQIPTPFPNFLNNSLLMIILELTLFIVSTFAMFKTKDLQSFFKKKKTNLILVMPTAAMLMSLFLVKPPTPFVLWAPHIFYIGLFTVSILMFLFGAKQPFPQKANRTQLLNQMQQDRHTKCNKKS